VERSFWFLLSDLTWFEVWSQWEQVRSFGYEEVGRDVEDAECDHQSGRDGNDVDERLIVRDDRTRSDRDVEQATRFAQQVATESGQIGLQLHVVFGFQVFGGNWGV
jgi:hypothetical protein